MIVEVVAPPVGVNAHFETGSFLWLTLEHTDDDLEFEPAHDSEIGVMPLPLADEFSECGLDLIDLGWVHDEPVAGYPFQSAKLRWALQHGIAPGQRFCMWAARPIYFGPDYHGEYDAEFPHWLVAVEPWSHARITRHWAKVMREIRDGRAAHVAAIEALKLRQRTDRTSWRLREHWVGRYNERLVLTLGSTHTPYARGWLADLVSAEADQGGGWGEQRERAMAELCKRVEAQLGASADVVRALERVK